MSSSTHCKLHGHDPDYECPYCKDAVLAALKTENERLKAEYEDLFNGYKEKDRVFCDAVIEGDDLRSRLAAAGNELDTLRKVVWHLEKMHIYDGNPWVLWGDVAKANGLDIAKLQKEMGK